LYRAGSSLLLLRQQLFFFFSKSFPVALSPYVPPRTFFFLFPNVRACVFGSFPERSFKRSEVFLFSWSSRAPPPLPSYLTVDLYVFTLVSPRLPFFCGFLFGGLLVPYKILPFFSSPYPFCMCPPFFFDFPFLPCR